MAGQHKYPGVEYAIFDMDGLLSEDSERIYTEVTNKILARYGKEMTWDIKAGVMGKVAHQAAEYVLSHFPDVREQLSVEAYLDERTEMQNELWKQVPLMAGAEHLVKSLGVPIALATGSSHANLVMKTGHLQDVFSLFPADSIITADSKEVKPGRGKPHPDIFLAAAASLGTAEECSDAQRAERAKGIVFEDAIPGVKAGVSAGMNVIWVPDDNLRSLDPDNDYGAAQVLKSLEQWRPEEWELKAFSPSPPPA